MDNKKRSTLSWSASLVVHAIGTVMIVVAGFHLTTPKGDVTDKTEFVTVDVNTPNNTQAAVPAQPPTEAPAADVAKPVEAAPIVPPPPAENVAATNDTESEEVPKPFTPTEADDNAPPAENDPAQAEAAADPAQEPGSTAAPEPNTSPTTSDSVVAAPNATPDGSPSLGGAETPAPNVASGTQGGPLIDETKLMEAFGNHKPDYPWMARLRRQQGTVVLRAFVDKDGGVSQVTIEQSSGSQLIDEEAQRAYERWRYQPGLSGQVLKPFKFSLK